MAPTRGRSEYQVSGTIGSLPWLATIGCSAAICVATASLLTLVRTIAGLWTSLVTDMRDFMDALGLQQVHYVGESIGGILGVLFCHAFGRSDSRA